MKRKNNKSALTEYKKMPARKTAASDNGRYNLYYMMINMQASAHSVRPRRIDAIRRAIPSESEHNLHLLARGRAEVAVVYRGQTRPWWDRAEKEMVYEAIAGKSFEDYVKLIAASA